MADQLTIENGKVVLVTEEGQQLERSEAQLLDMLRDEFLPPLSGAALPDGVKFVEWRPPLLLLVHQLPPHVRQMRWIANDSPAPYGPDVVYRKVRLSIPYVITFALFAQQNKRLALMHSNELYFRNEPLRSRTDTLGYPALLNISRIPAAKRERAWICTQFLHWPANADWTSQLQALLEHTWNGGFNLSSEEHEGASWFTACEGIHRDLHPVEKWEKASAANDAFALGVPWMPAPRTVAEIIDGIFEENQQLAAPAMVGRMSRRKKPQSLVRRFMNFVLNT